MSKQFNVKVAYEPRRISRIAVECPKCKKWFKGNEIKTGRYIEEEYEIYYSEFRCPICNEAFGHPSLEYYADDRYEPIIEEADDEDIYKDCLTKKTVWE